MMGDHRLDLAEALLAKARSTTFEGERASFVSGAYQQLGAFLGTGRAVAPRRGSATWAVRPLPAGPVPGPADAGSAPGSDAGGSDAAGSDVGGSDAGGGHDEAILVVDLAAAERAYRSQTAGAARSGVLIDLTI